MKTLTIIDDSHLDIQLLKCWIENSKDYKIVSIYNSSIEVIHNIVEIQSDICLIDAHMPLVDGIDVITLLLKKGYSGKPILMSHAFNYKHMVGALNGGAFGYCPKEKNELFQMLSKVIERNNGFDEKLFANWDSITKIKQLSKKDQDPKFELLNSNHLKILSYSCQGLTTTEIADAMKLKKHTIEQYRANMLQILGFSTMPQATAWAIANHLVKHGEVYTFNLGINTDI
ncbi:MAG: response regulator transcription factor [Bacteroidia bacterium]|jgi:DNA-binding NarL/FixJ family response regulator|nr:response regulator transcription factor [Bacteroidia bacterium]